MELIILLFFQKNSYMGISKMKTVYWQMVQVTLSKETKETQGKQGFHLEVTEVALLKVTDHFPHHSRRQWLLTFSQSSKYSPSSINHLFHYQILTRLLVTTLLWTQLTPCTAKFIEDTDWVCWMRDTRYSARTTESASKKEHCDYWPMTSRIYKHTDQLQLL